MCGRFFLDIQDQSKLFIWLRKHCHDFKLTDFQVGEVFPSQKVLALCAGNHTASPQVLVWGMMLSSSKRVINARYEDIKTKKLFQGNLENRCIIVASGFYEWKLVGNQKYKVRIKRPGQPLYMAGIFNEARELVILTGPAQGDMASIHDRCPIIIDEANILDYLLHRLDPQARNITFDYEMVDKPEYMQVALF